MKSVVAGLGVALGVIGPVALMTFGLLANGAANIIKGFLALRQMFQSTGKQSQILGEQTQYLTEKQLQEMAVAASLEQAHNRLAQSFTSEAAAIEKLVVAYGKAIQRQQQFAGVGIATTMAAPRKMQAGGVVSVPGSGKGDKVPAMLEPGEAVIPGAMAKRYAPLINGMIAGNIPGYKKGRSSVAGSLSSPSGQIMQVTNRNSLGAIETLASNINGADDLINQAFTNLAIKQT